MVVDVTEYGAGLKQRIADSLRDAVGKLPQSRRNDKVLAAVFGELAVGSRVPVIRFHVVRLQVKPRSGRGKFELFTKNGGLTLPCPLLHVDGRVVARHGRAHEFVLAGTDQPYAGLPLDVSTGEGHPAAQHGAVGHGVGLYRNGIFHAHAFSLGHVVGSGIFHDSRNVLPVVYKGA